MPLISPEEFASGFARRPGMYLGSPTLERAIGFVLGLEQIVMVSRPADPDVLSPIHEHRHLLRRHNELNSKLRDSRVLVQLDVSHNSRAPNP
jgi:hypothetical protein